MRTENTVANFNKNAIVFSRHPQGSLLQQQQLLNGCCMFMSIANWATILSVFLHGHVSGAKFTISACFWFPGISFTMLCCLSPLLCFYMPLLCVDAIHDTNFVDWSIYTSVHFFFVVVAIDSL